MFDMEATELMQESLAQCAHIKRYKANTLIYRRNQPSNTFYFLLRGKVNLYMDVWEPDMGEWKISSKILTKVIASVAPNSKVGEHFLFEKNGIIKMESHNLTALTSEESVIMSVSSEDMFEILHDRPACAPQQKVDTLKQICLNLHKINPVDKKPYISHQEINLMCHKIVAEKFEPAKIMIKQGEQPKYLLALFKGNVEVIQEDLDDDEKQCQSLLTVNSQKGYFMGLEHFMVDSDCSSFQYLAMEEVWCFKIFKQDMKTFEKLNNELLRLQDNFRKSADNQIEQLLTDEKQVNICDRQNQIRKACKPVDLDKLKIDSELNLEGVETNAKEGDDPPMMTVSIQKRNLENVKALDNSSLETLFKIRNLAFLNMGHTPEEAHKLATSFNQNQTKNLDNIQSMNDKKLGITKTNILLCKTNEIV